MNSNFFLQTFDRSPKQGLGSRINSWTFFVILLCLGFSQKIQAQAPNISYTSPQVYTVGTAITNLTPTNTGGAIVPMYVSTLAGTGTAGFVDGASTAAQFNAPYGVAVDALGNVYVADYGNCRIRKIAPDGTVSTIAGTGTAGSVDGNGISASFNRPADIEIDAFGNLYVVDETNNKIRKIDPSGVVTTFAGSTQGSANGQGTSAQFCGPIGVAIDGQNNLYITDIGNGCVRKITSTGNVTTVASGLCPYMIGVDVTGNAYVSDGSNKIYRITTSGTLSILAGSGTPGFVDGTSTTAQFSEPNGVAVDASGNVYIADAYSNCIRKITSTGNVTTVAGSETYGSTDGIGTLARFGNPFGLRIDISGNLYVADVGNNKIRKISRYSISPTLPAGLVFNTGTGVISGTPTATSGATTYTIKASNESGTSTTLLTISTVVPTLNTSSIGLSGFVTIAGSNSNSNSFTVSGTNLTNGVAITAPIGFEVSTDGSSFASTAVLSYNFALATIYVRIAASASEGLPFGNINVTSIGASSLAIPVSGTVNPASKTWNGSAWTPIGNPTSSENAIINGDYTISTNIVCNNLTINSGKTLQINAGNSVTINGNLINNGTVTCKSPLSSSAAGSLITLGTISGTGVCKAERYLTGGSTAVHYVSSPVSSAPQSTFAGATVSELDVNTSTWVSPAAGNLGIGKAFFVLYPAATTVIFQGGTFNTNTQNLPLVNVAAKTMLVGNPYPSAIDWNSTGVTKTNLYNVVYYRKGALTGTYNATTLTGTNGATQYIPAMQGFSVRTNATGASLTLNDAARLHRTSDTYFKSNQVSKVDFIRLQASNAQNADELLIQFTQGTSQNFDAEYDVEKLFEDDKTLPQLYSRTQDGISLVMNTLSLENTTTIPVAFTTQKDGVYALSATEWNVPSSLTAYLEDLQTQTMTNLRTNTYSFNHLSTDKTDRFVLHLSTNTTNIDSEKNQQVAIYAVQKTVYINNTTQENVKVTLFDAIGKIVYQTTVDKGLQSINVPLTNGLYLVKVLNNKVNSTQKVIIE